MPEKSVTEPLSGEEIRIALLDKISALLRKDCRLTANLAYDWYKANVKVELIYHSAANGDQLTEAEVSQEGKTVEEDPEDEFLRKADAELNIEPQEPNQVRIESGQSAPVLSTAGGKPEIKRVQYARGTRGAGAEG